MCVCMWVSVTLIEICVCVDSLAGDVASDYTPVTIFHGRCSTAVVGELSRPSFFGESVLNVALDSMGRRLVCCIQGGKYRLGDSSVGERLSRGGCQCKHEEV